MSSQLDDHDINEYAWGISYQSIALGNQVIMLTDDTSLWVAGKALGITG